MQQSHLEKDNVSRSKNRRWLRNTPLQTLNVAPSPYTQMTIHNNNKVCASKVRILPPTFYPPKQQEAISLAPAGGGRCDAMVKNTTMPCQPNTSKHNTL